MKFENCKDCREEVIWWAFFVNIAQTIFKGILGLLSGSAGLLADSLHSGADVVASAVTMFCVKMSSKPADKKYPFGYGNIQYISSAIVGMILLFGAVFLMYESILKIISGNIEAPSIIAAVGAAVTIVTNELMYRYQVCVGTENNSPAIIANAWDNRSDAMSSAAVLAGVVASVIGFPIADVLAAIGVSLLVGKIGIELMVESVKGLMDTSVDVDVLKTVWGICMNEESVQDIYFLRGRNVGEEIHLDIRVRVAPLMKVKDSTAVAEHIRARIQAAIPHARDIRLFVSPSEMEGAQTA
jgi:cation diffusion facilitator family transporter